MDELLSVTGSAQALFNQASPTATAVVAPIESSPVSAAPAVFAPGDSFGTVPAFVAPSPATEETPPPAAVELETIDPVFVDYLLAFDEDTGSTFVVVLDEDGEQIRRIPPDLPAAFTTIIDGGSALATV